MSLTKKIIIVFAIIVLTMAMTNCLPAPGPDQNSLNKQLKGCKVDLAVQETCQKCAKITKSNVVYPMCCANEEDVFLWCEKYIGYGI